LLRLRQAIGPVELIDARSDDPRIEEFWREGYDLNEGMMFIYNGEVYHGSGAVHMLASLSSRNNTLNHINARLFAHRRVANLLYPLLKLGRRVTLAARGRTLLKKSKGK
jgi:hypothetical protein